MKHCFEAFFNLKLLDKVRIKWKYVDFREARFRGFDEDKSSKGMITGF